MEILVASRDEANVAKLPELSQKRGHPRLNSHCREKPRRGSKISNRHH